MGDFIELFSFKINEVLFVCLTWDSRPISVSVHGFGSICQRLIPHLHSATYRIHSGGFRYLLFPLSKVIIENCSCFRGYFVSLTQGSQSECLR